MDIAKISFEGKPVSLEGHPLRYLFDMFKEMYLPGGYGYGAFPLEFREILAYSTAMKHDLRTWEIGVIRSLSEAYARIWHAKAANSKDGKNFTPVALDDHEGIKAIFSKAGRKRKD